MSDSEKIILTAVGDILIANAPESLEKENYPGYIFAGIAQFLDGADVVAGNLEGPLAAFGLPMENKYCIHSSSIAAEGLKVAGFDLLFLANNHILDYGEESLVETTRLLDNSGLLFTGAGKNIACAREPALIEMKGVKLGFLAYAWVEVTEATAATHRSAGVAPMEYRLIKEDILKLKKKVDSVIISLHWGFCEYHLPYPRHIELAHKLIDAGADVIIGHHPHVLQGIEEYSNGLIAYSIGNLVFPDYEFRGKKITNSDANKTTILLNIELSPNGYSDYSIVPLKADEHFRPFPIKGPAREEVVKQIDKWADTYRSPDYRRIFLDFHTNRNLTPYRYLNFKDYLARLPNAIRDKGLSLSLLKSITLIAHDIFRRITIYLRIKISGK